MECSAIIDPEVFKEQTVLIVEDNEDDRFILQCAFSKAGVSNPLQFLTNGQEAVDYLLGKAPYEDRKEFPLPVLILLDLKMPGRDGFEVLGWLRQQPTLRALTVHILTASSRAVDVKRAAELGANSYIIKPSTMEALITMVEARFKLAEFEAFPEV